MDIELCMFAMARRAARARAQAPAGPGISWAAVLLYSAGATVCFWAMVKEKQAQLRTYTPRVWKFWLVLGALMSLLAFDRLVGFHEWIGNLGRSVLKSEEAYEGRRPMQALLVVQALILGALALGGVLWYARRSLREYIVPIGTTVLLLTLVAVRMISHHDVDSFFAKNSFLGISYGAWFEAVPTILIAICAARAVRRDYRPKMAAFERRVRIR